MKLQKTIFILLVLIFSQVNLFAQSQGIVWSPEFIEAKGDRMGNILYDDGENVYVFVYMLSKGKKSMVPGIVKMDSKMTPVKRKDYTVSMPEKTTAYMIGMFYCGGKFIMLTYTMEKGKQGKRIYATNIDQETLEPVTEATEIWQIPTYATRENVLNYILSPDSSKFTITSSNDKPGSAYNNVPDKENEIITFRAFDSNLKIVNDKTDTLPYINEKFRILDILLTNEGTMYYFGKQYFGKASKEGKDGAANYNVTVLKYDPDKTKKESFIEMKGTLLDNLRAVIDQVSKNLLMFATYTDVDNEAKVLIEYEFIKFNGISGEVINRKKHTFDDDLIKQLELMEPDFKVKKNSKSIPKTFNIFDLKATADGRIYFVLEKDYYFDGVRWSQGMITFMHDMDGNRKWSNYIPKNQAFGGPSVAHPVILLRKDKIVIFYNDHDNIKKSDPIESQSKARIFNSNESNTLMIAEISNEGIMKRSIFSTSKSLDTSLMPVNSVDGKNNRFILYGWKPQADSYKIGVLEVN